MKNLKGTTVVITGASSGAGLAIALELAMHSADMVLASRNVIALDAAATECRQLGARVEIFPTDVSDEKAMINLAAFAYEKFKHIDVWINNAGVLAAGEFDKTPIEVHDQVIRTNLLGYMHGAHAVIPYFKKQRRGQLINNISIGAFMPVPFGAAYSASKFGLRGFSEALKAELISFPSIYVTDLYPAFLDTPGIRHAANYTAKVLKPAPPVTDPRRLARAVLRLIHKPRSTYDIGLLSPLIRIAHTVAPKTVTYATSLFFKNYFKQADDMTRSSGNLFNPLEYGNSIDGGYLSRYKKQTGRVALAGLVLGAGLLFMLTRKK